METTTERQYQQKQKQHQTLVIFQAKSSTGTYLEDSRKPRWLVYHLSKKFDMETCVTKTLCGRFHHVNWCSQMFWLLDYEELFSISKWCQKLVCERCLLEANEILQVKERKQGEEEEYDSDGFLD
jgi:hypothetical protein